MLRLSRYNVGELKVRYVSTIACEIRSCKIRVFTRFVIENDVVCLPR